MESRQVEFMLNQVKHSVFEGAWLWLILVVVQHHGVLIVVVNFEARDADRSPSVVLILPKPGCQRGFFYSLNAHIIDTRRVAAAVLYMCLLCLCWDL